MPSLPPVKHSEAMVATPLPSSCARTPVRATLSSLAVGVEPEPPTVAALESDTLPRITGTHNPNPRSSLKLWPHARPSPALGTLRAPAFPDVFARSQGRTLDRMPLPEA